jgi:CubicO group peptidase (beta-lactamase class C family)
VISRRLVIGLFGAGAIAVALYAVPPAPALSPESRNARLDQTLRGLVEGRSTPGIVALILQNGQPVYSRSVGVREVGSTALIGESDMFRLASMTKAVTSVAAMILIEQGRSVWTIRSAVSFPSSLSCGCVGPTAPRVRRAGPRRSANC